MKIIINSYTVMKSSDGFTVTFTFSQMDEDGNKVQDNARRSFVIVNDALQKKVEGIEKVLLERIENEIGE